MLEQFQQSGLNVSFYNSFYTQEKADVLLNHLTKYPFQSHRIYKKTLPLRKVVAFGDDPSLCYRFSGSTVRATKWTPLLLELKKDIEKVVGTQFNYVLLTLYPDGSSGIGAHRDDERDLDPTAPIACLSFGAERKIVFRWVSGGGKKEFRVGHGSLYVMRPPTQLYCTHEIPVQKRIKGPRISLTFRRLRKV